MSFSFYYDLTLEIRDEDIVRIFPANNNANNINLGKTAKETDANGSSSNSNSMQFSRSDKKNSNNYTKFIMTYGDYMIDEQNKTVYFPFMNGFDIEVYQMGGISNLTTDLTQEKISYQDDNGTTLTSVANYIPPYNCIIKINFEIPEFLTRYLPAWEWIPKILFAKKITAEQLKVFPLNRTGDLKELESYSLIIKKLYSVDFNGQSFNPITSSGNGNSISFTRTFAGISEKIDKFTSSETYKKQRREEIISELKKSGKQGEITVNDKVNAEAKADTDKNISYSTFQMSNINNIRPEEKELVDWKIPIISFIPDDVDFETKFYADDTASETAGILQYSNIMNKIEKRMMFLPDSYDIYITEPVIKNDRLEDGKSKKTVPKTGGELSGVAVNSYDNASDILKNEAKINPVLMKGRETPPFQTNITLPYPIVKISLFDTVQIINSWLGIYDGFWKVMKITYKYDESGKMGQELTILPKYWFESFNNKKVETNDVKIDTAYSSSNQTVV